jgi:hypothetical protein
MFIKDCKTIKFREVKIIYIIIKMFNYYFIIKVYIKSINILLFTYILYIFYQLLNTKVFYLL